MAHPITFTETENRNLQQIILERYQDDRIRSLYGSELNSILHKLEVWPSPTTFTEQESLTIQYQYERLVEILTPYPYPYSPLTFGQDTQQLVIIKSILAKVKAGQLG